MTTYTVSQESVDRAFRALARAADELSRAHLVICQEADGDRPHGRTIKTLHDIACAMSTQSLVCTEALNKLLDEARASAGLPALVRP